MKKIDKILKENGYVDGGDRYEYKFTYPQLKVFAMVIANENKKKRNVLAVRQKN